MNEKSKYGSMIDLLQLQKQFILNHLGEGDVAVDFTMGNGHDTAFLSKTVGKDGHVYAFDVQEMALASTAENLEKMGCEHNYTLILDSHHNVKKYVQGPIKAGMFNLGYLPGSDKKVTTMRKTTMPAIEAAVELLDHGGVLLVAVYPGHAEGDAEGKMVLDYFSTLDRHVICCTLIRILNSPTSPFFIVVEKK
ncbi:MAG: class I SAM-dependent methyltransferase [Clostridia bacterium]|nr:class I SAM-dependent methyltransferase [Clostridia bacterium]